MQARLPVVRLTVLEVLLGILAVAGFAAFVSNLVYAPWRERAIVAEARLAWEEELRQRRVRAVVLTIAFLRALYPVAKLLWQIVS